MLKSLFEPKSSDFVPSICHGRMHEQTAISNYIAQKAAAGCPVSVRQCGLVLDTDHRYLGASPNGMVFDASAIPRFGLLEVECPFTAFERSLSVQQAAEEISRFCLSDKSTLKLSRGHPYWWQVQGRLAISRLKWCDFFVWVGESTYLERVEADHEFWTTLMLPKLQLFYSSAALPYLKKAGRPVPAPVPDESSPSLIRGCLLILVGKSDLPWLVRRVRKRVSSWTRSEPRVYLRLTVVMQHIK